MLQDNAGPTRWCGRRREFLRLGGGLAVAGFSAAGLAAKDATPSSRPAGAKAGARSCILVYLLGGPPHLDLWDLKPNAPAEIRGPYNPIATAVPGMRISELHPRLATLTCLATVAVAFFAGAGVDIALDKLKRLRATGGRRLRSA